MNLPRNPHRRNVPPYRPPGSGGIPRESQPTPPVPAEPPSRPLGVGLVLRIEETWYGLTLLPAELGSVALRTWRLAKMGGDRAVYQVTELPWSEGHHACECGDWHFRHEGEQDDGCKHIRAIRGLVELGLLAPLPWLLATDQEDLDDLNSGWTIAPTAEDLDRLPGELAAYYAAGGGR